MGKYVIIIGEHEYEVYGSEAAFEAFESAADFGCILGLTVDLVDAETGEVLASRDYLD